MVPQALKCTLFAYTTLFRSKKERKKNVRNVLREAHSIHPPPQNLPKGSGRPIIPRSRFYKRKKKNISNVLSRSEEHTSELQSLAYLVCRLLLEKKKGIT